jgi:hypothetical protein
MGLTETTLWFQIVLADQDILKGETVIEVVNLLRDAVPAELTVLVNPEWKGCEVDDLRGRGGEAVAVRPEELARRIGINVRFNWGTIFFTNYERQQSMPIVAKQDIAKSLASSFFAIRFVDGHLLFVYTPYQQHLEDLKKHFTVVEAKELPFSDLVFPY